MAERRKPAKSEKKITTSRKKDHVDIILKEDVRARANAWDDVALLHEAMPEVDLPSVSLATTFLGARLEAPVMIASMTGGYPDAERINGNLAAAAAEAGVALGVGSQRAALVDPSQKRTFSVVRKHDVPFVAANIGAPQLVPQGGKRPLSRADVSEIVAMVEADALIVHLNFLQEAAQPEGDLAAAGVEHAIRDLAGDLGIPVIAKETGAGMRRPTAERLRKCGVAALDVGGLSGTTFAAVELFRARKERDEAHVRVGELYRDWGVPTVASLVESRVGLPVVATGGLRSGLDAARAMALGATLAGYASAALHPANVSGRKCAEFLGHVAHELKVACFLTGARSAADLAAKPVLVGGHSARWLEALGHPVASWAKR
ncbi:MAG TPA: type 2 isopentenyl-diphosphate Delta-isomerase [Candidatus Thermoplasmatota archaeon]|nr:type 2 isopentenyl-diphosphate Delta-isomerase [Candidatus Thermoplasmatota archaeon]